MTGLAARGWKRFAVDPGTLAWAGHALAAARAAISDPGLAHWHVCAGTWFVGVDALGNDAQGRVAGSGPLTGPAVDYLRRRHGPLTWDIGQVSAVFPGYPRPRDGEGAAAFRYRRDRDAAHVDGLKPVGPDRRRMIRECHAFILGLPLTETSPDAAPLVVWEGSPAIIRAALLDALDGHDPAGWGDVDVTGAYRAARREVFETCRRVVLHVRPGEAYALHRLALHGVAPWADTAIAPAEGRVIAYFRPPLAGGPAAWLQAP